jgi:hypothetical protein
MAMETIRIPEQWDATFENVQKLIDLYVPADWHNEVRTIFFEPDQMLNKVRYGQAVLVDGESVVSSFEYSFDRVEYTWDKKLVKRSFRWNTTYDGDQYNDWNTRLYL